MYYSYHFLVGMELSLSFIRVTPVLFEGGESPVGALRGDLRGVPTTSMPSSDSSKSESSLIASIASNTFSYSSLHVKIVFVPDVHADVLYSRRNLIVK